MTTTEVVRDRVVHLGLARVARDLDTHPQTVASWLAGICRPATALFLEHRALEVFGSDAKEAGHDAA